MTDFQKGRGSILRLPPPPRLEADAKTIPLPVMGAEIILAEPYNRRISDENGMFAFQVQKPGRYKLSIDPTPKFKQTYVSKPEIILKHGKGGWFKSNFYVQP